MKRNKFLFGFTLVAMLFVLVLCIDRASVKAAETVYGDVDANASVNVKDLVLLEKHVGGILTTDITTTYMNNDGKIDAKDTISLRRELAGIENVNVDISSNTSENGTATLVSSTIGGLQYASYLKTDVQGSDCFEFTYTFTESGEHFLVGARLDSVTENAKASQEGIILDIFQTYCSTYVAPFNGANVIGKFGWNTTLELNTEYTFKILVVDGETEGTSNLIVSITGEIGGTETTIIRNHEDNNTRTDGKSFTGIPDTGYFAVWNLKEECIIDYAKPYKAAAQSYVVDAGETDDAITLFHTNLGTNLSLANASYLQMSGDYTTECFEFTKEYVGKDFYVGARLETVTTNGKTSKGLYLQVGNNSSSGQIQGYYANGSKISIRSTLKNFGYLFETGVVYRFKLWVFDGTTDGTSNYVIQVGKENSDGSTTWLGTYNHENDNTRTSGTLTFTELASSGSFAVWTQEEIAEISYKMPTNESVPVQHKIVSSTDADAGTYGTANLYVNSGGMKNTSCLEINGDYANECFEFTTTFTADAQLYIGARMDGVTTSVQDGAMKGIVLQVYKNKINCYSGWASGGKLINTISFGKTLLEANKEYTFVISVEGSKTNGGNKLVVTIKDGQDNEFTYSINSTADGKSGDINGDYVNDSGSFAVWSLDPTCTITYRMPYTEGDVAAYYARQE